MQINLIFMYCSFLIAIKLAWGWWAHLDGHRNWKGCVYHIIGSLAHPLLFFLDPFPFNFHTHGIFSWVQNSWSVCKVGLFSLTAVSSFSSQATTPLSSHRQHNRGSVSVWWAARLGQDHSAAPGIGPMLLWCLIINSISTTQCLSGYLF